MIVNGKEMKVGDNFDCPKCGRNCRWRGSVLYKGVRYCKMCYIRVTTMIGDYTSRVVKMEDAVKKVRNVNTYNTIEGHSRSIVSVPSCYIGKKVRVVVVEDDDEC